MQSDSSCVGYLSNSFIVVHVLLFCAEHRISVGSVHVGLLLSPPLQAQTLLLMDLQTRDVLFYQGVETMEDLNPVFLAPSMKPFRWTSGACVFVCDCAGEGIPVVLLLFDSLMQIRRAIAWPCIATRLLS